MIVIFGKLSAKDLAQCSLVKSYWHQILRGKLMMSCTFCLFNILICLSSNPRLRDRYISLLTYQKIQSVSANWGTILSLCTDVLKGLKNKFSPGDNS